MANEMIVNLNHKELEDAIKASYTANVPLMIWGAPGIGKSQVVRAAAEQQAKEEARTFVDWNTAPEGVRKELETSVSNKDVFIFCDIRLSQYEPSDFALPWAKDGAMIWIPSSALLAFSRPETHGVLFLDELPQAMPAVQNAAYQIILDRGYKETSFRDIRVIAAGNRAMDGGSQFAFPPALANRLSHVELETPDGKTWCTKWASKNEIHPMVMAFIMHDPTQIYESTGKTENRRFAHATPRSWESCSKLLRTLPDPTPKNMDDWVTAARVLVYQTVGRAASIDFMSFMEVMHAVSLDDVLKDPESINDLTMDQQLGVFALIEAALVAARKEGDKDESKSKDGTRYKKYGSTLVQVLDILEAMKRKEFVFLLLSAVVRSRPDKDKSTISTILSQVSQKHYERYVSHISAFSSAVRCK